MGTISTVYAYRCMLLHVENGPERTHTGSLADFKDLVTGNRSGKETFHYMPLFLLNLSHDLVKN